MDAADSLSPRGLDAEAVAQARRLHGRNVIEAAGRRGPLATLREVLSEPMFVLLLAIMLGAFVLGLHGGLDAAQARALAIVALTSGSVALAAVGASAGLGGRALLRREFLSVWIVGALALALLSAGLALAPLRALLQCGLPPPGSLALVLAAVLAMALMMAAGNRLLRRHDAATGAAP